MIFVSVFIADLTLSLVLFRHSNENCCRLLRSHAR
jgi:hypothetical protein